MIWIGQFLLKTLQKRSIHSIDQLYQNATKYAIKYLTMKLPGSYYFVFNAKRGR